MDQATTAFITSLLGLVGVFIAGVFSFFGYNESRKTAHVIAKMNHELSKEAKEHEFKLKHYEILANERLNIHKKAIFLVEDILESSYKDMNEFQKKSREYLKKNRKDFSLLNTETLMLWWQLEERMSQFNIVITNYPNDKRSAEYHRDEYLYHGFTYLKNKLYRDMIEGYDIVPFLQQLNTTLENHPFVDEYNALPKDEKYISSITELAEPKPLRYPTYRDPKSDIQAWEDSRLRPVFPEEIEEYMKRHSKYPIPTPFNTPPSAPDMPDINNLEKP